MIESIASQRHRLLFVLRRRNDGANQTPMLDAEAIELVPEDYFQPLNRAAIFARSDAPLEVDVGSGDGSFLVAMAERYPERNFLGIERLVGRVRKTCRRAAQRGLQNVRVLLIENAYAVRHLLERESVST